MFLGVFEAKMLKIAKNYMKIGVGITENAAPALFLCSKTDLPYYSAFEGKLFKHIPLSLFLVM